MSWIQRILTLAALVVAQASFAQDAPPTPVDDTPPTEETTTPDPETTPLPDPETTPPPGPEATPLPDPETTPLLPEPAAAPAAAGPPPDLLTAPSFDAIRIPPRFSYEFAFQATYGSMRHLNDAASPWIGFGVRGGWGKNFGLHRVGIIASITIEGEVLAQWSNVFEPAAAWDYVHSKGLWLGASLGTAMMANVDMAQTNFATTTLQAGPMAGVRLGYSQSWTRVGRRFFIGAEPKVRLLDGQPAWSVALVLGLGSGY